MWVPILEEFTYRIEDAETMIGGSINDMVQGPASISYVPLNESLTASIEPDGFIALAANLPMPAGIRLCEWVEEFVPEGLDGGWVIPNSDEPILLVHGDMIHAATNSSQLHLIPQEAIALHAFLGKHLGQFAEVMAKHEQSLVSTTDRRGDEELVSIAF